MGDKKVGTYWWEAITRKHKMLIIAILSFGLYVNTIGHEFTLDDAIVITDNDFTKAGVSGIPDLFKYDTFRGFFKVEGKAKLVSGGRYRPLTPAFFALEYSIFGEDPTFFHLMSVLWFTLLCLLCFLTLERLFTAFGYKVSMLPFVMVVLFAVHPIHTEVVANIKGRDEIMSMFFGMAALYFMLDPKATNKTMLLSGLSFFLAMLAKEMAATFIPIALVIYFILSKGSVVKSIKGSLPLLIAFVPYLVIRFAVLGFGEASDASMQMMNNPFIKQIGGNYSHFSVGERIASIVFCLGFYIKLLFIPHPLTHDYYPRQIGMPSFGDWEVLVTILVYIGLVYLAIKLLQKNKIISFGILFFLISLILVSNVFFPIGTHMGERFLFMGSLGFCIVLGRLLWKGKKTSSLHLGLLGLVVVAFAFKTIDRNRVWVDDYTLFNTDVHTSTNSAKVLNAAAGSTVDKCLDKGGNDCDEAELRKAIDYENRAIRIHPQYKNAYLIRGNAYFLLDDFETAIANFKVFKQYANATDNPNQNLMLAYISGAKQIGESGGDLNKAKLWLSEAFAIDSTNMEVLRLSGIAYGVGGDIGASMSYFQRILNIDPNNADAYQNIGVGLMQLGRAQEAEGYFAKARELGLEMNQPPSQ